MNPQRVSFDNGLTNMIPVLEDYASDSYALKLAGGDCDDSCRELAECFDDMYFIIETAAVSYLGLTDEIVAKLAAFRSLIFAAVDDGGNVAANGRHFLALYQALRDGTRIPEPPPRGPRWRSDAQIVVSDDWIRIQAAARDLLHLLSSLPRGS